MGSKLFLGFKISCMVGGFFPSSVRFQNHNLSCPVSGDSYRTFLLITFIASLYSNNMDEIVMLAVYMVMILGIIAASYLLSKFRRLSYRFTACKTSLCCQAR